MILFQLSLLTVLTYFGAWISACETALFSLPVPKIKAYKSSNDPRKKLIANLLSKSRDLLVTIFIINTITNILLQNVASSMFGMDSSLWLRVGVPLLVTLILGEIIPKYYGLQNNVSFSLRIANSINFWNNLISPLRVWIVAITVPISRFLFFFLKKEENLSKEELEHVVISSEKKGLLNADESQLVSGYLNLQDTEIKELMWPRNDVITYDINQPLSKLSYLFVEKEVSRLPIVDKTFDHVLGIIDAFTYFKNYNNLKEPRDLISYLKKPFFIPESITARNLLKRLQTEVQEIALVVDEYGSITGLITREDLMEVVVGQIEDQRDQEAVYTKSSETEIMTSGKLELSEFNQLFKTNLTSENNMITIGGWIIEKLGDIPKSGSKYELSGFLFQILSATPTHIDKLFIRKLPEKQNG